MTRKHIKLAPQVRCIHPGCGRSMYYLNTKGGQEIYGCTDGHIRKIERSTERNNPPQDAA